MRKSAALWWIAIALPNKNQYIMRLEIQYGRYFLVSVATLVFLSVSACKNKNEGKAHSGTVGTIKVANKFHQVVYTCPMHNQVREDAPGKCPICGMTLVPIENKNNKSNSGDSIIEITLSRAEQQLGGIHSDTATWGSLVTRVELTGATIFDPRHQQVISAPVSGWIGKLYARNPGEMIHPGQKLYDLYSPDLLSAEKDYVLARKQKNLFKSASVDFTATIQAMKLKLSRLGLTGPQIDDLQKEQPIGRVTIFSEASGYLTQKMKEEGDYVNVGDAVMDVAQNKTLWVQAELYDSELPLLTSHPEIWVEMEGRRGKIIPGHIVFNNPDQEQNSRVHLLNIAIPNPERKIPPGMLAYVYLQTVGKKPVVLIPKSSLIYNSAQDYVWIQRPDFRFEMRRIQLGPADDSMAEILAGINPGEKVVSQGAFLLNSAYILRYGAGVNMAGMEMSDMKITGNGK